jgi:uncharacterized protein (DUF1501 family)
LLTAGGARLLRPRALDLAFAAEAWAGEILVVLFLRGGCDGLSMVPPVGGRDRALYEESRPSLRIPEAGDKAALQLDDRFGLHPAARPLVDLYRDRKLAIIHATGLTSDSRSHFDAQAYMELGTPDRKSTSSGWITRHLQSLPDTSSAASEFLAVSVTPLVPTSLLALPQAAVINGLGGFNLAGNKSVQSEQMRAMREMYSREGWLQGVGREALNAVAVLQNVRPNDYVPANGAQYPKADIGNRLKILAQLIKMDLGVHVATVDMGGWDTHKFQGTGSDGYFANLVGQLSQSLVAFYQDLSGAGGCSNRLTIVVMSEFGRRVKENANHGTDHGHGNIMMVLGDHVNGGRVYGEWPGLATDRLYDRADLAVTTDYRRVLAEIATRRLRNQRLDLIFPDYRGYKPQNLVSGPV